MYLLNKQAYSVLTGQNQDEEFKTKALKRVELTYPELKKLNPQNQEEPKSVKVFIYNDIGMTRIYFKDGVMCESVSKHISQEAVQAGKNKAGY